MTQWRRHGTGARRPGLGKSPPHRLLGHLPLAILIRTSSSLQPSRPHHVCPWTPQCPRVRTWTRFLPLPWASPSRLPQTSSWIATHEEPSMGTGCPPQPSSSLSHSPPILKASGFHCGLPPRLSASQTRDLPTSRCLLSQICAWLLVA